MLINPLSPPIPRPHDNLITWEGLSGGGISLAIATLAQSIDKPVIIITPDVHAAEKLLTEIQFFLADTGIPGYLFPDRETLPYDHFSPHEDLTSERLRVLSQLPYLKKGVVIASISTLMHRLPPKIFLHAYQFSWKTGDQLDLTKTRAQLVDAGYHATEQVMQHGEFAVRGAIIDVFPMGSAVPFRVELFDNDIESIRTFDSESQKSIEKVLAINLLPAHEYPLTEASIAHFRNQWRAKFSGNPAESPVYQQISKGQPIGGIEYYLPLFFENTETFFDYCPNESILVNMSASECADILWREMTTRYTQLNVDKTRPLCTPDEIFIPTNELFSKIKSFTQIRLHASHIKIQTPSGANGSPRASEDEESIKIPTHTDISIDHKQKNPLEKLERYHQQNPGKILICAESTGRREIIVDLFKKNNMPVTLVDGWTDFLTNSEKNAILLTISPISSALFHDNITVLTETQLFGQYTVSTRQAKKRTLNPDNLIRNLVELHIGAPVVHIDHGVGKYIGLEKITTDGVESEYVTLEYADRDRIYVPIHALHLINRYAGSNTDTVALTKLSTPQWERAKQKAAKHIHDIAADLLKIYAEREASTGFSFQKPNDDFLKFRAAFPFEETPDQTTTIDAVIQDMTSSKCMDRLVCGDVGFGKTEIAMQAAFLAIQSGKQVMVLVPTTLLANQHSKNFQDRFSEWPVKIGILSRLQSTKDQNETIEKIKTGHIDIIVGTHKLLNQKITYKDLGLLIIDEEHRFGVAQKEKIKSLRAHLDILTLTATPIPRTLNLAMAGMRDLSIIATPPLKRLSIKTFIHNNDEAVIREAIVRETMRGGQVYFLHNEVTTMPLMMAKLQKLLPNISIAYAHGQMPERQLEKTMSDFYHQRFQVLLSTTIIESGIDIPSANTIIINDANEFGLAQLHQIRGRVGRSHHQAYAYLLVKDKKALTKDAEKRLDAISTLEDLGVGFQLATHDLEIRGAGELLGASQSGHLETIGFTLYMELLEQTIAALKAGKKAPDTLVRDTGPEIELHICALFPESYIADVHTRLILYKRLSHCESEDALQSMKAELIDRFGLLPEPTQHLFALAELKIVAKKLGVVKIEMNKQFGYLHFNEKPKINPTKIITLIQTEFKTYQLAGKNTLRFKTPSDKAEVRIEALKTLLSQLN